MFFKNESKRRKECTKSNSQKEKIPENRMCSECEFCEMSKGTRIKDCICICKKNPKHPINMGNILHAQHKYQKKMKEEQKRGRN